MSINIWLHMHKHPDGFPTGSARLLFNAMVWRSDPDGGNIYESIPHLAKRGGIATPTAWRVLPGLLKSGLVVDTGGRRKSEHGKPVVIYRIDLSKHKAAHPESLIEWENDGIFWKASQRKAKTSQDDRLSLSQESITSQDDRLKEGITYQFGTITYQDESRSCTEAVKDSNSSNAAAAAMDDSTSSTGNPETGKSGDGWTAYAEVMGKLIGEKVKPYVHPKPKPPVQPVGAPVQPVETPVQGYKIPVKSLKSFLKRKEAVIKGLETKLKKGWGKYGNYEGGLAKAIQERDRLIAELKARRSKPAVEPPPPAANPPKPANAEGERLAGIFYAFLGKSLPEDAPKKFDALIQDNPDLDALLVFALKPDSRWAKKIGSAVHPFAYLKSTLENIRDNQERYEQKKAENAARAAKDAPGDDEDFSGGAAKTEVKELDSTGLDDEDFSETAGW